MPIFHCNEVSTPNQQTTSSVMSSLTAEQRDRVERNRLAALERKKQVVAANAAQAASTGARQTTLGAFFTPAKRAGPTPATNNMTPSLSITPRSSENTNVKGQAALSTDNARRKRALDSNDEASFSPLPNAILRQIIQRDRKELSPKPRYPMHYSNEGIKGKVGLILRDSGAEGS